MENLASQGPPKGPPMKNLVCNEKFGIKCASAEAKFGTGRGIIVQIVLPSFLRHRYPVLSIDVLVTSPLYLNHLVSVRIWSWQHTSVINDF